MIGVGLVHRRLASRWHSETTWNESSATLPTNGRFAHVELFALLVGDL
jgi:hypothetical protein